MKTLDKQNLYTVRVIVFDRMTPEQVRALLNAAIARAYRAGRTPASNGGLNHE